MTQIKRSDTADALYEAAANFIVALSRRVISETGKFTWALSGGSTPNALYALLVQDRFAKQIDWENVFVFWSDERFVEWTDAQSNSHQAMDLMLKNVAVPEGNIFRVPVQENISTAAEEYEETIKNLLGNRPVFDLVMLGLGPDGHTASLFPGTKGLSENAKLVIAVDDPGLAPQRVSFTYPLINAAANIMFLVSGRGKAEILKNILAPGEGAVAYPAQKIAPVNGELYWFADRDALSLMPGT